MEKAYESERIYEINSDEWLLGRLLGMPQSEVKQKIEKSQTQHIAADHSLQMISNLEKKLSELRGEILETIQKGDNEPRFYNDSYTPPEGYTASGYYKDKYYEVPTTPSDGATNWKQRNPDLRSAPNDSAMRSNSAAMNRGKPKPKRPDFANGNPYGESETGDWRETPNPPADHPNFQAMRPPQQVMGPYNGPPERNPYNQDPIESFVEAGRVIRDKVNDGVKRVGKFFNGAVEKAGNYSPETYPEDPRYPPENWNRDQDPRYAPDQRTSNSIAQAPSMSIEDIINSGRGIGGGIGRDMPRVSINPPANTTTPSARPRPTYKPSEGPLVTDDDENLANTDADYGRGSNESATRYGPKPTYQPSEGPLVTDDDENLANTDADYGRGSNESARRYGPPSIPTATASGNRGPFPEIADAAKTGIKRVGNAVNTGLKTAATVKNTISGGLNEIKNDMTGNSVGKSNSYRLLEDDGHVLRRGLTAENYEMIKGLAVVLRISETEVLHRLEKNGAL